MTDAAFNQEKFEELQGKVMVDVGGAMGMLMAYIGDQTGVYKALEEHGPCSHEELAELAGVDSRYLREWLSANSIHGYVNYDAATDSFSLSPEQAAIFCHEGEPTCMQGFFQAVIGQMTTHDLAVDVFKTGRGRPWAWASTPRSRRVDKASTSGGWSRRPPGCRWCRG